MLIKRFLDEATFVPGGDPWSLVTRTRIDDDSMTCRFYLGCFSLYEYKIVLTHTDSRRVNT